MKSETNKLNDNMNHACEPKQEKDTLDEMRKLADEFDCTIDYLAVEHAPKPDTAA